MKGDNTRFVRARIRAMPAYEPILPYAVLSQNLGLPQERIIKLDANENPYGPLPEARQALAELDQIHIYPDPESRRIRSLLADYHQIPAESIVMGAGADELIDLIMRTAVEPDDHLLNCPPTFGMYAFDAAVNGLEVASVPRLDGFKIDQDRVLERIEALGPKAIFIAHPNNPDGGLADPGFIQALLTQPILVIVDEAYIDFSPQGSSWLGRVSEHSNLIVLRTFSKWAGLAGLRVGYGVFPEPLVPLLMKAKQPYNVSSAAEAAACASMKGVVSLQAIAANIIASRARLQRQLSAISWLQPYPSSANFILCRVVGLEAREVKQRLMAQGILIRFFDKPGLTDHIRISVGKPEHNEALVQALRTLE